MGEEEICADFCWRKRLSSAVGQAQPAGGARAARSWRRQGPGPLSQCPGHPEGPRRPQSWDVGVSPSHPPAVGSAFPPGHVALGSRVLPWLSAVYTCGDLQPARRVGGRPAGRGELSGHSSASLCAVRPVPRLSSRHGSPSCHQYMSASLPKPVSHPKAPPADIV